MHWRYKSFLKVSKLYENGISIDELAKSLMKFSYNLALVKSEFNNGHDFLDIKSIERLKILSAKFEMDFIIRFGGYAKVLTISIHSMKNNVLK